MVVVSVELLGRCVNQAKRRKEETLQRFLRRVTHVYLNNKHIERIENLECCTSLSVLYLYENEIERIENLEFAATLTNLYLSKNRIRCIENLRGFPELSKLYLGHNQISVLEGLEGLPDLRELHIEFQLLPLGEQLLFDPLCLGQLSDSLTVLNISGNGLHNLEALTTLHELAHLVATHNQLHNLKELLRVLRCWPRLQRLDLTFNPVCHRPKYLDNVVVTAPRLVVLDSKEITPVLRNFVQAWQHSKDQRRADREPAAMPGHGVAMAAAGGGGGWQGSSPLLPPQASPLATGGALQHVASSMSVGSALGLGRVVHRSPASNAVHDARTRFPDIFAPSRLLRGHGPGRGSSKSGGGGGRRYDSNLFTGRNIPESIAPAVPDGPQYPVTTRF